MGLRWEWDSLDSILLLKKLLTNNLLIIIASFSEEVKVSVNLGKHFNILNTEMQIEFERSKIY